MQTNIELIDVSIRPEGKERVILFQFTGNKFFSIRITKGITISEVIDSIDDLHDKFVKEVL